MSRVQGLVIRETTCGMLRIEQTGVQYRRYELIYSPLKSFENHAGDDLYSLYSGGSYPAVVAAFIAAQNLLSISIK
jgi:hypothetical protein